MQGANVLRHREPYAIEILAKNLHSTQWICLAQRRTAKEAREEATLLSNAKADAGYHWPHIRVLDIDEQQVVWDNLKAVLNIHRK